jgi:hypothetical protein
MKKIFSFSLAFFIFLFINLAAKDSKVFDNPSYGYKVDIPTDWVLHHNEDNISGNRMHLVGWGLPKVYSEEDKGYITHFISFFSYDLNNIRSVEDMVNYEFQRIEDIADSVSLIDSIPYMIFDVYSTIKNKQYRSKTCITFKNGIGYTTP